MNNTIEQYAKGNIKSGLPEIILSDTEITVSVEVGKVYSGTIILTNEMKAMMKGVVFSSSQHIKLKEEQFVGAEVILHYTIDVQNLQVSETMEGTITIVSDCGERTIPVKATAVAMCLRVNDQIIKNLFQFTDLAKEDWESAVTLFKSAEFEKVLLDTEPWRYREIYHNLLKGRSPSGALEEFLIAIHKKQPIQLSVSRLNFTYETVQEPILDKILITKDLWGFTEIRVRTDAEFIELDRKILWTDHFIGNQFSLQFKINPDKLNDGKNQGKIYLETILQTYEIEVVCNQRGRRSKEVSEDKILKQYSIALLVNYLDFRLQKIDFEDYITLTEEVIKKVQALQYDERFHLLECHLLMMRGERLKAKEILERYDEKLTEYKENNPVVFCAIYYLKALVYQEEAMIQNASEIIRGMYQLGNKDFMTFWFLIYMDKRYIGNRKLLLSELKEQYELGCHSPMMYFEAMNLYQAEPALLIELDEFTIQTMHFGIKKDFVSEDVARQYAYLVGKERYYKELVFHSLEMLYEKYPQKDILTAICSMLIKGHQRGPNYFKWYKLGVEAQLRVTELHEYFMYSIDETSSEPLPQQILLYFIYNSRLNDKKRAYLYARIVKEKALNPSIYRTYAKKIEQFALKQLLSKNINENLAILYENLIEEEQVTQEAMPCLAELAYRKEILCENENIKGVYVIHKELKKEEFVPLVEQRAYVDVYTDQVMYFFVDQKDQRYVASIPYEEKQLLKPTDQLQNILYYAQNNFYPYIEQLVAEGAYRSFDESAANLCKSVLELTELKEEYKTAILVQLICYYYSNHNIESLDYYLEQVELSSLEVKSRRALVEIFVEREKIEDVMKDIEVNGYEELNAVKLGRFCALINAHESDQITKEQRFSLNCFAFEQGCRDAEVVAQLVSQYTGPTKSLIQLQRTAKGNNIPAHVIEEQIIAQVLFTKTDITKILDLFMEFYRQYPKALVCTAYLNYASYQYLVKEIQPRMDLLGCMKHEVLERKNLYCIAALLKYFSLNLQELIEDEKPFVTDLLEEAVARQLIIPEFMALEEKIAIPNSMRNRVWIQYRAIKGVSVKLFYRIREMNEIKAPEYVSEVMRPSVFEIYVKSFLLFCGETLEYYFVENIDNEEVTSEVEEIQYQPSGKRYGSTFEELNHMIELFEKKEETGEELAKMIDQYVKKEYVIGHYFRMLS